jgi:hypothetical protein
VGFVALALIAVAVLWVLVFLWTSLLGLPREISTAIVAGSFTVIGSTLLIAGNRYLDSRRAVQQALRAKKVPLYEDFVAFWMNSIMARDDDGPSESDIRTFMVTFTPKLLAWGSDGFVAQWSNFRSRISSGFDSPDGVDQLLAFEVLLFEIRRDLGHSNKGLATGALLGLFISDTDKLVRTPTLATEAPDASAPPTP